MISFIYAKDMMRGIGYKKTNALPWPLHDLDMKWFKSLTYGHPCVAGRKTFESIASSMGKDIKTDVILSGRRCIMLSSTEEKYEHIEVFDSASKIMEELKDRYSFVIGGAETFISFLKERNPDFIYETVFMKDYDCDVRLPNELKSRDYTTEFQHDTNDYSFRIKKAVVLNTSDSFSERDWEHKNFWIN